MVPLFAAIFIYLINILILMHLQNAIVYESFRSMKWYRLRSNEIKVYQLVLHHSQTSKSLTIATIWPLNMETCVSVKLIIIIPHLMAK